MTDITIIGAGVSGLTTAYLLKQKGLNAQVLEARNRLGGRTLSPTSCGASLDLGAAWIWPHHQHISALVEELGIQTYPQYETGYSLYETQAELQAFQPQGSNFSQRFPKGTQAISLELADRLQGQIRLETRVKRVIKGADLIDIHLETGEVTQTKKLIFAMPPRVIANTITFNPDLPESLVQAQQQTHTWMGNSAKALITYNTPFWRKKQLSGSGISYVGPLGELHDNSPADASKGVIKGFFAGMQGFAGSPEQRKQNVINQLSKLYGPEAQHPLAYQDYAWWQDELSSAPKDHVPLREHPQYGNPEFRKRYWEDRLLFAGAETAVQQGGYLDGAVEAAKRVVAMLDSA